MAQPENSVIIDSGKVIIIERNKPARIVIYITMFILGVQSVLFVLRFGNSQQLYHLVIAVFFSFLLGLVVSREVFFRTYKNEINIHDISRVRINNVPFGNGNVHLKLKLGRKTRQIFIDRYRAEEIKAELDPLS